MVARSSQFRRLMSKGSIMRTLCDICNCRASSGKAGGACATDGGYANTLMTEPKSSRFCNQSQPVTVTPNIGRLRRLWLDLLRLARYFDFAQSRKEGRAMTFFRHYRQCGPVNALQMRL